MFDTKIEKVVAIKCIFVVNRRLKITKANVIPFWFHYNIVLLTLKILLII